MDTLLGDLVSFVSGIAPQLPTGLIDPEARQKYVAECEELHTALVQGDWQGALTECADVAYYAAKRYVNEETFTLQNLHFAIEATCDAYNAYTNGDVTPDGIVRLVRAKYTLRATGVKDDAAERAACVEVVG